MTDDEVLNTRIDELTRRIQESEDDRRELWRNHGALDKEQAVIGEAIKVLHEDIENQSNELRSLRHATWTAALSFMGLIVTVVIVLQPAAG